MHTQPKNPLHGVKLEEILEELVATYGREELGKRIKIKCFTNNPSIKSSLSLLRNVDLDRARIKVENLYIRMKKNS